MLLLVRFGVDSVFPLRFDTTSWYAGVEVEGE